MKERDKNNQTLKKQLKRIQIIALISFGIALIAIYLMTEEHMTVESILSGVGSNSPKATFMLLLLFGIKSLSIVIPLPSLYLASGLLYHPVKAVAVSYLGLAITLSIPYILGRWAGGAGIDYVMERYPKMEKVIAMQKKNEFFSNFIVRIIGWFPCDILSFYFGATATPYPVYLGASLLGSSIGVITNTLLGDVILNPLSPQFAIMIAIKIAVSAAAFGVAYRLNKKENQNGEQKDRRSER